MALNASSIVNGQDIEHLRPMGDALLTRVDVAFRRVDALERPCVANQESSSGPRLLSSREEER